MSDICDMLIWGEFARGERRCSHPPKHISATSFNDARASRCCRCRNLFYGCARCFAELGHSSSIRLFEPQMSSLIVTDVKLCARNEKLRSGPRSIDCSSS